MLKKKSRNQTPPNFRRPHKEFWRPQKIPPRSPKISRHISSADFLATREGNLVTAENSFQVIENSPKEEEISATLKAKTATAKNSILVFKNSPKEVEISATPKAKTVTAEVPNLVAEIPSQPVDPCYLNS